MPIHGYENLKPKQIGFVVASFAAAALLTMAVCSVLQSAAFGLVAAVFALSFFLTLNEHEQALTEPPKQSNRAQDLIAQMKDYQTPNGAARQSNGLSSQSDDPSSQSDDPSSQSDGLSSQSNDFSSQSNGPSSQFNGPSSQSNGLSSQSNGLSSQSNGLSSQSNGLSSQSNGLSSQSNGVPGQPNRVPSNLYGISSQPYGVPSQIEEPPHDATEPEHVIVQHQSALDRAMIARQRAEAQVAAATGEAPSSYLGATKSAAEQLSAGVLAAAAATPLKDEAVHIEYDNFPPSQLHASAISDQQFDQSLLEALPTAISTQRRVDTNLYKHREHKCWKCKEMMYLYTWKGHEMWSQVPPPEPKPDSIQYRYYQTIAAKYWANVCTKCDTVQGDHLIFDDLPPALWENID